MEIDKTLNIFIRVKHNYKVYIFYKYGKQITDINSQPLLASFIYSNTLTLQKNPNLVLRKDVSSKANRVIIKCVNSSQLKDSDLIVTAIHFEEVENDI